MKGWLPVVLLLGCAVPREGIEAPDANRPDGSLDAAIDVVTVDAADCVPTGPETCNDLDDDCNGTVDDIVGTCDTGMLGICATGRLVCAAGRETCSADALPTDETCNLLDDDCNGVLDDLAPDCDTGLAGACAEGFRTCSIEDGACVPRAQSVEICNGADDDCDEAIDEECVDCDTRMRDDRRYLFCQPLRRWVEARTDCEDFDSQLVRIDDDRENDWIETQIDEIDIGRTLVRQSWWIGLRDVIPGGGFDEDEYRWVPDDGSAPVPSFDDWQPGEPNGIDDCARIWNVNPRRWTDHPCDDGGFRHRFICEDP